MYPHAYAQPQPLSLTSIDSTGHRPQMRLFFLLAALASGTLTPALVIGGYLGLLLGALILYAKIGIALYWLHGAWKRVPMDWMFPINLGLCDAMERLRQQTGGMQTAKRDIAMYAAIAEIIPFVNFFVAPFLWLSYMRSIDAMHDEIMASLAARYRHV